VKEILHVAYRRLNVYVSPDQYMCNLPGMHDYILAANGFLAKRFLYGSSYPFIGVKLYRDWFATLPIKPHVLEGILYRNAAKFFGL